MKDIDKPYRDSIADVTRQLTSTFNSIAATYKFDLTKTDISEAIVLRLKSYYTSQNELKQLLGKGYAASASDFFVETVLFFTKLYLKQQQPNWIVVSEKEILLRKFINEEGKVRREVIRPDITIYNGDEVIFVIECKTQLGRSRSTWQQEYISKKERLAQKFPNAKSFLLVMTEDNWEGFGNDQNVGKEYFALLKAKVWPTNFNDTSQILTKIEDLFKQLIISK